MTKHQACKECHRDFVGPDSDIGFNYCIECSDEILDKLDPDTPPYAREDVEALMEHCWEYYTQHEYRCPEGRMCVCPYPELLALLTRLKGETKGTEQ